MRPFDREYLAGDVVIETVIPEFKPAALRLGTGGNDGPDEGPRSTSRAFSSVIHGRQACLVRDSTPLSPVHMWIY